mgnify:CR=1 FL=1
MELKPFQRNVLQDLETYLQYVQEDKDYKTAFERYWGDRIGPYNPIESTGMKPYQDNVKGAVHACIKVPTAGGKTFIACNALKTLFDAFDSRKSQAVVWLVPWSNLLDQTYNNLSDPEHPYRQKLNTLFNHKVEVYKKEDLLQGSNFNPTVVREQLSIFVLSFASLRARKKEDRKVFEENGQLAQFTQTYSGDGHILEGVDETALINVIRSLHPVVIVDESHNAESELSVDMLNNLNPAFILDLTATPKDNSNIISLVSAIELKKEHMVKLPVIVYNQHDKTEVVNNALHLQRKLETLASAERENGGRYIRPIVLFQAQPRTKDDNVTFEKIKQWLLDLNIPEAHIKIKTANKNELKDVDLMAEDCPVRYIITINALKEGWDCPFAYILASLADKTSVVDVEQILGRVLRQPYVQKHDTPLLNLSYVLTASSKFYDTLQNIIKGLQEAGFSEHDYRKKDLQEELPTTKASEQPDPLAELAFGPDEPESLATETEDDIDRSRIHFNSGDLADFDTTGNKILEDIEQTAIEESDAFEEKLKQQIDTSDPFFNELPGTIVKQYRIKEIFEAEASRIALPQFFLEVPKNTLFETGDGLVPLGRETLLEGFKLSTQNTEINFDTLDSELYKVDLEKTRGKEYVPKFMKLDNARVKDPLVEYIVSAPKERQIKEIAHQFIQIIGNMAPIPDQEIKAYIKRILEGMTNDQLMDCFARKYSYKDKIKQKIRVLADDYAEKEFFKKIDTGKIKVQSGYKLPKIIVPGKLGPDIMKSLYEREANMNRFEEKVIDSLAALDNLLFWHRNLERGKGFALNGYKSNHYPDFLILTRRGTIILLETKGDDRDNSDSIAKNKLGKRWAQLAGPNYRYFMVFDNNKIEDARNLDEIREIIKEL